MRETQTDPRNARLTTDLRPHSACWKARIRLPDGKWHQFSIGWDELSKAKDEALKHCSTADFKQKDTLPPCARKFRCVMPRALAVDRSPRQDRRSRTDRTVELAGGGPQPPRGSVSTSVSVTWARFAPLCQCAMQSVGFQ